LYLLHKVRWSAEPAPAYRRVWYIAFVFAIFAQVWSFSSSGFWWLWLRAFNYGPWSCALCHQGNPGYPKQTGLHKYQACGTIGAIPFK
jgi:hypothetical protein